MESTMKLTAYVVDGHTIDIRPAPADRDWMDNIDQRFAYRCLPLSIANAHGWEILCAAGFSAVWDGGRALDAVTVTADQGAIAPADRSDRDRLGALQLHHVLAIHPAAHGGAFRKGRAVLSHHAGAPGRDRSGRAGASFAVG